jgi:hypothetical protein
VIVLHVVVDDDYWPFRTAVSRPVALFLFPFINFHVLSSRSVTVSLPAPNLADQLAIRGVIETRSRAALLSSQPRTPA